MFFTDDGNAAIETQLALATMDEGMESGAYLPSNPQVVRLAMIDDASPPGPTNPDEGEGSGEGDNNGGNSSTNQNNVRVGLFVGVFGLVAILSGVLFRINRHVRDGDAELDTYQADNTQNVSVLTQSMPDDSPPML
jgi:hypothetical protein